MYEQKIVDRIRSMDIDTLTASIAMMACELNERRRTARRVPITETPRQRREARKARSRAYNKAFGERLREMRSVLGKTEAEMARLFEVTAPTYVRYEAGCPARAHKQQAGLSNLADLGIAINYIVAGTLPMFKDGKVRALSNVVQLAAYRP